ncbi:MAG: hypothetical protein AVDCRST_MAG88-2486 [uncultured Thermomicrobiales bacterium]|uniref:Uncharacterized protein n=1 Tax=uncultured Thermomicrobiales bacterium TaxID=1645740 RepID=A0A6J4VDI4_9BACT|nr:MAG: hypothetical protein AVDCRST_MAG88-2486 [uncultured Thermomicrobiales bacterium]
MEGYGWVTCAGAGGLLPRDLRVTAAAARAQVQPRRYARATGVLPARYPGVWWTK